MPPLLIRCARAVAEAGADGPVYEPVAGESGRTIRAALERSAQPAPVEAKETKGKGKEAKKEQKPADEAGEAPPERWELGEILLSSAGGRLRGLVAPADLTEGAATLLLYDATTTEHIQARPRLSPRQSGVHPPHSAVARRCLHSRRSARSSRSPPSPTPPRKSATLSPARSIPPRPEEEPPEERQRGSSSLPSR